MLIQTGIKLFDNCVSISVMYLHKVVIRGGTGLAKRGEKHFKRSCKICDNIDPSPNTDCQFGGNFLQLWNLAQFECHSIILHVFFRLQVVQIDPVFNGFLCRILCKLCNLCPVFGRQNPW